MAIKDRVLLEDGGIGLEDGGDVLLESSVSLPDWFDSAEVLPYSVVHGDPSVLADKLHETAASHRDLSVQVGCALVKQYLGKSLKYVPHPVLHEAVLRVSAYLRDTPPNMITSVTRYGSTPGKEQGKVDYGGKTLTSALRYSNAMSLLSPFKRRRAGGIG